MSLSRTDIMCITFDLFYSLAGLALSMSLHGVCDPNNLEGYQGSVAGSVFFVIDIYVRSCNYRHS